MGARAREARGERDAAAGRQAPRARSAREGGGVGEGLPQVRGEEACGRSGHRAGSASQQRRVQLHDSGSDRRRHPAGAGVPGGSGQPGGLRQLGRVALDVAGAPDQVPAGVERGGQPPGAQAEGLCVRDESDARGNGSRQVLRRPDHRLLQPAATRATRIISTRHGDTNIARRSERRRPRSPTSPPTAASAGNI